MSLGIFFNMYGSRKKEKGKHLFVTKFKMAKISNFENCFCLLFDLCKCKPH